MSGLCVGYSLLCVVDLVLKDVDLLIVEEFVCVFNEYWFG